MTQAPTIAEEQRLIAEDFELFDDWRERIEYVRTATYKIVDGVIRECWIVDAPPVELAEFLRETVGSTPSSPTHTE